MADKAAAKPENYKYAGSEKDDAIINKVEAAIKNSPMGKFQAWLGDSGPVKKGEVDGKVKEADKEIAKAKKDNPEEAKKAGEPPPIKSGNPVNPNVKQPSAKADGGPGGKTQAPAGDSKEKKTADKKPPQGKSAGGGGKGGGGLASKVAGMNDAQLATFLNNPANVKHSSETKDKLAKIKQMAGVAKGFDGQLDKFVSDGSLGGALKSAVGNFLGKKDLNAVWADNPYRKVGGTLGKIMTGLSAVKKVTGIVGSVAGKIGMVLTVVGLLGMIVPPIGTAVSGIARIINIVGLICDAISFVLGAILTGLNGVVLAQQIAKGGSAEEKAATADLMATEATETAGSLTNLAMHFGGKFMKGFLSSSKGVIGSLIKRFKAFVGKIVGKVAGNVKNLAKKFIYKLGFGLGGPPGKFGTMMGKVWNAPGALLDKVKNSNIVKKINSSKFMQGVDKFGAKAGNAADWMDKKIIGNGAEKLGEKLAGAGAGTKFAQNMTAAAERAEMENLKQAEKFLAEDVANREKARLQKEIKEMREQAQQKLDARTGAPGTKAESKKLKNEARDLNKDANKLERQTDRKANEAGQKAVDEKQGEIDTAAYHDAQKKKAIDVYKEDPKKFEQEALELQTKKQQLEAQVAGAQGAQKDQLEKELRDVDTRLQIKSETRSLVATGGEEAKDVKTLWDAKGKVGEGLDAWKKLNGKGPPAEEEFDFKNPLAYNKDMATKEVDKASGHKDADDASKADLHQQVTDIHAQTVNAPPSSTSSQVDSMLTGLGGEATQGEGEGEKDKEGVGKDDKTTASGDGNDATKSGGGNTTTPDLNSQPKDTPPAKTEAKTEEPKETKKDDGGGGLEEIPYWPALIEPGGGEFGKALDEMKQMRRVAEAFKKAQLDAKKKAYDTMAVYGKYDEYAKEKKKLAADNKAETAKTKAEAGKSGEAASGSEKEGSKGEGKQNEAKSAGNEKVDTDVQPPEEKGFWAKIIGRIKRWACEKAAKVFGWIQEKIGSLILQGLCGVSMGDIKAYGAALRSRMAHAKGTGDKADQKSDETTQKSVKLTGDVDNAVKEAVSSANECDQNIADADKFLQDLTDTEQDIVAEQAKAGQFLASIKAAAADEKAKKEAEEKAKAEKEKAAATAAEGNGNNAPSTPSKDSTPKPEQKDTAKENRKPAVSPADVAKIKGAAAYVSSQSHTVFDQVKSTQEAQSDRLKTQLEGQASAAKKHFKDAANTGKKTVDEFKKFTDKMAEDMRRVQSADLKDVAGLQQQAQTIRDHAKSLDEATASAYESLNNSFKAAYESINSAGRSLKNQVMKSVNSGAASVGLQ